ncbi:TrmH family RNA methyltransferase [Micropruina sonneratiae]|uniref:TrmH family RNA methyltransferase n=1 Tax=Micropruina sonneratiae TaxID=2986940 RepID=UPI00222716A5|nr:RNA methyltransferase [Micropruina sp. KQZ13P-5]MCW3157226.1 RNA methyltransferase [Micropruina sp. KQZ13P-5]
MPQVIDVEDPSDPRLADYVALRDAALRRHLESERGLFIAEGEKVIRRAIEAGYRPRSFLLAPRWLASLADVIGEVPVYRVSEATAEAVSGFHVHRGALASVHRETRHRVADLLGARRLMVCEDVVDHTNVGAILRNAAGLGWDGVLLAPRCADPLYRRAIKTSMGAVFSLPWARLDDWAGAVPVLQASGFTVVALALAEGALELDAVAAALSPDAKVAVLLGTEGAGLSQRWIGAADAVARIPMRRGIDSLNVAAASAIAGYVLR